MEKQARIIALYLPQFHPIPENDIWWGKGFTEWTNVGKAKPLFKGHYQPRVPADLGYYDLRMPEIREQQAEMAKEAGIEGFCYWHYWFGNGKQLLERPFNEVLKSGKPDFPFCLGWANHSWTNKNWSVVKSLSKEKDLITQIYPGEEDHINHFNSILPAFKDRRYIQVDGMPLFTIFRPLDIPDVKNFIKLWNKLAVMNGLKGIHFVGMTENFELRDCNRKVNLKLKKSLNNAEQFYNQILNNGFDAVYSKGMNRAHIKLQSFWIHYLIKFLNKKLQIGNIANKFNYSDIIENLYVKEDKWENVYPSIIPNWDRSPRSGNTSIIWHNSTPALFKKNIKDALELVKDKQPEHKIIFLQSWNEWAEGNYVEPDIVFGKGYLNSIKECILKTT